MTDSYNRDAVRQRFEEYITRRVASAVDNLPDDPDVASVENRMKMNCRTEIIDRLSRAGLKRDEISVVTGMLKPNIRNYLQYTRPIYRESEPFKHRDDLRISMGALSERRVREVGKSLHSLLSDIISAAAKSSED